MPGVAVRVEDTAGNTICCRIFRVDNPRKPPATVDVRVPVGTAAAGWRHVDSHEPVTAYTPVTARHTGRDSVNNETYLCTTIERTPDQCSLPV